MAIPKLYRSKILALNIDGEIEKVEVRGYRPGDVEYASQLQSLRNELPMLYSKLKVFQDLEAKLARELQKHPADEEIDEEEIKEQFINSALSLKDEDYTEEDLQEIIDSKAEVDRINREIEINASKLGQRGLKRTYYKDEEEFKEGYAQAERDNKLTEYLDNCPDIEIDQDNLQKVAFAMIDLSAPSEQLQRRLERKAKKDGKGKSKKTSPKRRKSK